MGEDLKASDMETHRYPHESQSSTLMTVAAPKEGILVRRGLATDNSSRPTGTLTETVLLQGYLELSSRQTQHTQRRQQVTKPRQYSRLPSIYL